MTGSCKNPRSFCATMTFAIALLIGGEALLKGDADADQDAARAIITKAIQAHGGEAKLARLKALRMKTKGSAEINNITITSATESASQLPNRYRVKIDYQGWSDPFIWVFDGNKAWKKTPGSKASELEGTDLADMQAGRHETYTCSLLPLLKDSAFSLSSLGEIQVKGRAAVGVRAKAKGQEDIKLYFDKANGLLVKSERQGRGSALLNHKEVNLETFYRDYKDFDGLKQPATIHRHEDGRLFIKQEVIEMRFVDKIDDSEFAKP